MGTFTTCNVNMHVSFILRSGFDGVRKGPSFGCCMLAQWVPISCHRPSADGTEEKKKKEEYCGQEYNFGKGYTVKPVTKDHRH